MKKTVRFLAMIICVAVVVTCFAGCHKKNETAVKIGDYKFTAGYYACALVYADTEARQKIDDELSDKGKSTENVDYLAKKVDGVKFEKWVKDKAIDNLKINAGYMQLCKELKITLDETDISTAENYAQNYWQYYGYSQIFGDNGVSYDTFKQYTIDTYCSDKYFDAVYGKEGTSPVTEEQLKEALKNNYQLVYKLETDTSSMSDEDKETKKAEYELYLSQFKSGTSFEDIQKSANGSTEDSGETTEETTDGGTQIEEETAAGSTAADKAAELIGNSETDSSSDYYDDVKKMELKESKIIEKDNSIAFIVKLDVESDPYYLEFKDETLRKLVAGETSKDDARKKADKLGVKQIDKAVNLFKVKKIKYPDSITIG